MKLLVSMYNCYNRFSTGCCCLSRGWCVLMFPFKLACPFVARSWELSIKYRGADKSLARPTTRCILFDGENISCDASLVIYK